MRISSVDSNTIQLQIAAREFVPKRRGRPIIWLTGVSHIGDTNYYAALQRHLDAQTLVLYEGVSAAEAKEQTDSSNSGGSGEAPATAETRGSFQSAMAASLGLVFQLEAIQYHRDNFKNSDLSIDQLRTLMANTEANSGESGARESFESLLQTMDGSSWLDALLQLALRIMGANPKFQALGRLALIDLLGTIQGDPSRLEGLPPDMKQLLDVLLQRRNEKVVADIKAELSEMDRADSIAVFFGTGHMPDLEQRLRRDLGYVPANQTWFTAFSVDLGKAGVSQAEKDLVENFVKWQLKQAGAGAAQAN
ncbi:MAG TPA: hypothetical protein VKY92_10750 [Verrucomicrobiae bacterium]|nr:hypothetical protein [Verrucomicrobiae bacterium]